MYRQELAFLENDMEARDILNEIPGYKDNFNKLAELLSSYRTFLEQRN